MGANVLLALGLIGIFAGILILLTTIGVLTTERSQVARSLAAVRATKSTSYRERETATPFVERVVMPSILRLSRFGRRFTPGGQVASMRHRLDLAGNPAGWDVDRILAFKALGTLLLGVLGLVLGAVIGKLLIAIGLLIALALVGYYGPDLVLYQMAYNRREQISRDLADSLDLLTVSVEAGLGFDAALSQVARNSEGPLAEEFFRILKEMQIGVSRSDAFRGLTERTEVPALRAFVAAIVQADAFGIPIANVLRVQSKELRIKRSQMIEEKAQKVPVKILFPLIFCILPTLFIIVIGPAGISIVHAFSNK